MDIYIELIGKYETQKRGIIRLLLLKDRSRWTMMKTAEASKLVFNKYRKSALSSSSAKIGCGTPNLA